MRTAADFDQPDAGRRRVRRRGPILRRWERQLAVAITITVTAILTALSVWGVHRCRAESVDVRSHCGGCRHGVRVCVVAGLATCAHSHHAPPG